MSEKLVTVGVDTHTDVHVAAVLGRAGRLLETASFPATTRGYARLATWAESFGEVGKAGMEGTGSFGAGLLRLLPATARPLSGSTGPTAPDAAATANLIRSAPSPPPAPFKSGRATAIPKPGMRTWRWTWTCSSSRSSRLLRLSWPPCPVPAWTLPGSSWSPPGITPDVCGPSGPLPACAASRRSRCPPAETGRHRLHRGGDRDASSALWRIALVRIHCHQPTRDYVARRTAERRTRKEILRCLKRSIAREVYGLPGC